MVALAGGETVAGRLHRRACWLQAAIRRDLEKAITPRTKWIILCSPSNRPARPIRARNWKAITDVLVQVSERLGDDRRHVRASGLRRLQLLDAGADRAETVRPHADGEWRLESLLHDRLAHQATPAARLELDQGDADDPVASRRRTRRRSRNGPRSKRSTVRRTSFRCTTRCSRSAATSWCRCSTRPRAFPARGRKARSTSIRPAPGPWARPRRPARCSPTIEDFVTEPSDERGRRPVVQGSAFGLRTGVPGFPTRPKPPISKTPASASSAFAAIPCDRTGAVLPLM